jgi:hypothetical protein
VTDEVTQRGIWREWKRVMTGVEDEAERAEAMRLAAVD